MFCPNCQSPMVVKVFENQTILHCDNCGGSYFEENGINRITLQDAEKLGKDKQTDEVSGNNKLCLKDNSVMKIVHNEINIPDDVTLLQCPLCKSIFIFAEDLIAFKLAQEAKINYFKAWNIPLPSLSAVVVMSFIALVAAVTFSQTIYFQKNSVNTTQANDMIKKSYVSKSGQYIFVSFTTEIPVKSEIIFKNKTTGKTMDKVVSSTLSTIHYITTGNLNPNDEIYYTIVIKDKNGKEVRSEERKL